MIIIVSYHLQSADTSLCLSFYQLQQFLAVEQFNVIVCGRTNYEAVYTDAALLHPQEGETHYLILACKCLYVCVQRFVSQDFLPPEFQHLVLSGAWLRPGLMVKLFL